MRALSVESVVDTFLTEHNLTEAIMNTQEPSIFLAYEQQKAVILRRNLPHKEYEQKIKELAKRLGV
jgi:hypothetical protein